MALSSARRCVQQLLYTNYVQVAGFATGKDAVAVLKKDWKAVQLPKDTASNIPTTIPGGQAFGNDLRGTSGLCLGDGIKNHTDKWLQVGLLEELGGIRTIVLGLLVYYALTIPGTIV